MLIKPLTLHKFEQLLFIVFVSGITVEKVVYVYSPVIVMIQSVHEFTVLCILWYVTWSVTVSPVKSIQSTMSTNMSFEETGDPRITVYIYRI